MTINSKCGKKSVTIIRNGRDGDFMAIANQNCFDSETMSDTSYWFTIGRSYKTEKSAIRQAVKKMAQYGYELATV